MVFELNRLFKWITDVWLWLSEGKIPIMCLLVLIVALYLGLVIWCSETSIRSAGYALQVVGMFFAIRGLIGIRSHFEQPLLRQLFVNWLKRFPKWKRNVVIGTGSAQIAIMSGRARAEVWTPDDPDQPVENRIQRILRNLERIRKVQGEHAQIFEELRIHLEEHKKKVAEESKNMEEKIRLDLESLHTNDVIVALVGLVWLTVGLSMSTMAPELYELLK